MIIVKKAFTGAMLALVLLHITTTVDSTTITGNGTEPTTNKTDTGAGEAVDDSFISTDLKVCLIIAALLTVIAVIACYVIKKKSESSGYASGNNIPKPLAGLSDDF